MENKWKKKHTDGLDRLTLPMNCSVLLFSTNYFNVVSKTVGAF